MAIERLIQQHISEYISAIVGYLCLLPRVTVIFKAQYNRIVGGLESAFGDRFQHFFGADILNEGIAVDDYRLFCSAVPEVQFNASEQKMSITI